MRKVFTILIAALLLLAAGAAVAEEAADITGTCKVRLSSKNGQAKRITDGTYTKYWESEKSKNPWVTVESPEPVYGLYLCFQTMPESYVIQQEKGGAWETIHEGDTRFFHVFYPMDGARKIRIYATDEKKTVMGFNEIFVFGEGEIPDWVQRWEPTPEKAEILFVVAHPDDELLFLGSLIAWYGVEQQRDVTVAYLTISNTTRRSEALNGLWTLGIRTYPVFGGFRDVYSNSKKDPVGQSYKDSGGKDKVQAWVTGLYRQLKPDVVVTHDPDGEYGHPQHKMIADAAAAAYTLAADPSAFPESAEAYGVWQVKKLYMHLYGEEADQTQFDWTRPMESLDGQTPNERAEAAYAMHKTQAGAGKKFHGKFVPFSVEEYGVRRYPNNHFGLYATQVGPDMRHDDLLENLEGIED